MLNFDDSIWENVPVGGSVPRAVSNIHMGLNDTLGAQFVSNPSGGTRQYFRRLFILADRDGDQVPDDVDLCPEDPTGGERDSNGNGLGDSCDFCADCRNVAYGQAVTVNSVHNNDTAEFGPQRMTNGAARCDRWASQGDTGWVEVDLGARYSVCSARVYNTTNCGMYDWGMQAWRMMIRDEDSDEETLVGAGDIGADAASLSTLKPITVDFGLCRPARYVKVYVDRAQGGRAALGELQVYGEPL